MSWTLLPSLRNLATAAVLSALFAWSPAHAQSAAEREAANQLLDEGFKQFQAGNMSEARSNFEIALEIDPDNSLAHFHAADIYQAVGEIRKMKQSWEKAATLGEGTAHGIKAKFRLRDWNKKYNNRSHDPEAVKAFSRITGRWCSISSEKAIGKDKNGNFWTAQVKTILNISEFAKDGIYNFSIRDEPDGKLFYCEKYLADNSCEKPHEGDLYSSKVNYDCDKNLCFDFGHIQRDQDVWVKISYGTGDREIGIFSQFGKSEKFDIIWVSIGRPRHNMPYDPRKFSIGDYESNEMRRCK